MTQLCAIYPRGVKMSKFFDHLLSRDPAKPKADLSLTDSIALELLRAYLGHLNGCEVYLTQIRVRTGQEPIAEKGVQARIVCIEAKTKSAEPAVGKAIPEEIEAAVSFFLKDAQWKFTGFLIAPLIPIGRRLGGRLVVGRRAHREYEIPDMNDFPEIKKLAEFLLAVVPEQNEATLVTA